LVKKGKFNLFNFFNLLFAICLVIFAIGPLIWMLFVSLRQENEMFNTIWTLKHNFTLDNFKSIFSSGFLHSLKNSFIASIGSTLISLIFGVPAAFALSQWTFRLKHQLSWLILVLRMAPPIGFVIPFFLIALNLQMIDNIFTLIIVYLILTLPLTIWLMWMFFSQLPESILEASWIDGASVYRGFFSIAIPLSIPGIITSAILSFSAAWNDFFFALILTRSNSSTAPVAVSNFVTYSSTNWTGIASAAIILALPTIPMIFLMQKYLVQGITGGAVKE